MSEPELIPESWTLGQCVYEMSTGKRCQKQATVVLRYGPVWAKPEDLPAYGYCGDHYFSVTKPRDPRIHKTAEPLIKAEPDCIECGQPNGDHAGDCGAIN